MSEDKYPGLPDITPDPKIRLDSWMLQELPMKDQTFYVQVRRAFVQNLIARYPITSANELREAIRRRFGSAPSQRAVLNDLKELRAVRVPMPGGGQRYKLASQLGDADVEEEFDERVRIDVLSMRKKDHTIHIEMNRGTTTALVQLLNLLIDDGQQPWIYSISTDGDKWITIHFEDRVRANQFERWMEPKIF